MVRNYLIAKKRNHHAGKQIAGK